jgi:hypothetical protein
MDINEQIQSITTDLMESVRTELRGKISDEVTKAVNVETLTKNIDNIITQRLEERVIEYNIEAKTRDQLDQILTKISSQLSKSITITANEQIAKEVARRVAIMDTTSVIKGIVEAKIGALVQTGAFGQASINHSSIDFNGFKFSGDMIKGGIVENFGSTGIDDRSTEVQLTILDNAVAFEKSIWAPNAKIKGDLEVDGEIKGSALEQLVKLSVENLKGNKELLQVHSDAIHKDLTTKGLDLDKITQQGKDVISGSQLGYHITDSNLQRVGQLKELQTKGEALLSDTLYVTTRRVGVNTIEPSATFVIWDEEVELVVAKQSKDTAFIGMPRYQRLVLGANGHTNLTLDTDGSVEIENLRVGNTPMSSASAIPNYDAITGTIVWNENPAPGGPVGWICLGAVRWAKFGIIE